MLISERSRFLRNRERFGHDPTCGIARGHMRTCERDITSTGVVVLKYLSDELKTKFPKSGRTGDRKVGAVTKLAEVSVSFMTSQSADFHNCVF